MTENDSHTSHNTKKHRIVQPKFYIDDSQRVICESHNQIERIRALSSFSNPIDIFETRQLEQILTCKTCKHYQDDTCYFPKSEINKIEEDRLNRTLRCNLCGGKIDRPMTIMYSMYNKEKFNVHIPTVCCMCFESLDNNSFLALARKRIIAVSLSIILMLFSLFTFRKTLFALTNSIGGIIVISMILALVIYMILKDGKNLVFLLRGRKFYQKTYGKAKQQKKGEYVGDFPFD